MRSLAHVALALAMTTVTGCAAAAPTEAQAPSGSTCPAVPATSGSWVIDETGVDRPAPVVVELPHDLAVPESRHEERPDGRPADAAEVQTYEKALARLRQSPFRVVERDLDPGIAVRVIDQDHVAGLSRSSSVVCPGRAEVGLLVVGDRDLEPIGGATSDEQVAHPPEVWVAHEHANSDSDVLQRLDPALACLSRCQLAVLDRTGGATTYLLSENEPISDLLRVKVVVTGDRITAFHTWQDGGTETPNDTAESAALLSDLPANEQLLAPDPQTVLQDTDLAARQQALPGADDVTTVPLPEAPAETCSPPADGYSYCSGSEPSPGG